MVFAMIHSYFRNGNVFVFVLGIASIKPCTFKPIVAGSNDTKISYYSRKISYFGNGRVYLTDNITFSNQCAEKSQLDGWLTFTKNTYGV